MKKHFTLIELLFVVVIIAVLAGMLLPALNAARNKARAVNCESNLKEIGVALSSYANEMVEMYPASTSDGTIGESSLWTGLLVASSCISKPLDGKASCLVCPSYGLCVWSDAAPQQSYGIWMGRSGYGAVASGSGSDGSTYYYLNRMKIEPTRALVMDSSKSDNDANWLQSYVIGEPTSDWGVEVESGNGSFNVVHARHSLQANCLFNDGHVEAKGGGWLSDNDSATDLKYRWMALRK